MLVKKLFYLIFNSRGSISSYTKISRNSSFRFDPRDQGSVNVNSSSSPGNQSLGAGASKKDQSSVIKKLVNNLKQKSEELMRIKSVSEYGHMVNERKNEYACVFTNHRLSRK